MYDWIIEADLYRYQQALSETHDRAAKDRLTRLIASARQRLFQANLAAAKAAHAEVAGHARAASTQQPQRGSAA